MIPGKSYTPQDVLKAAWRRRWWVAVPFTVLSIAAFVFVMSLPYNYRSVATLQVLPDPVASAMRNSAQPSVIDRLSSIGQETLTRTRLEQIINELDLYPELRRTTVMENVVFRMRSDISFQPSDRDLFTVGFTARSPEVALTVASRLSALFLEANATERGKRTEGEAAFLGTQVEEARQKLEQQEKRIEAYRTQYTGELPTQLAANVQELNNSQLQLRSLSESLGRDRDQRLFLQRQLELARTTSADGAAVPSAARTPGSDVDDLPAARVQLRNLEMRLTPEHPDVQRQRSLVAQLEQKAAASAVPGVAPRRTDPRQAEILGQIELIDRQLASRAAEEAALRARIADYKRRVDATPLRETELASLSRDYEDTKRLYSNLLQHQQEAGMAANLARKEIGDQFRIIDPARLPEKPFSPSRRNFLAVGLLAALAASLLLAVVIEYRDSSLRTDEDVAVSLRLPVLATIPVLNRAASGRAR
jgi:polysaccharide chain length determinant protein (PEP-CTERM system associated)